MNSVKSHFENAAPEYTQKSKSGLWKIIRNAEAKGVMSLLPLTTSATSALELGCGTGYYSDLLLSRKIKNLTCVDFSEEMLNQLKSPLVKKVKADIENYNVNEKFDVILCAGALEFTEDPQKVFENVSSMLSPTGVFILLYPTENFLGRFYRRHHKRNGLNVKLFSDEIIQGLSKAAGLFSAGSLAVFPFTRIVKLTNA